MKKKIPVLSSFIIELFPVDEPNIKENKNDTIACLRYCDDIYYYFFRDTHKISTKTVFHSIE